MNRGDEYVEPVSKFYNKELKCRKIKMLSNGWNTKRRLSRFRELRVRSSYHQATHFN